MVSLKKTARNQKCPYFPAFGVSFRIQPEYGKMWNRVIPNTDPHELLLGTVSMFYF